MGRGHGEEIVLDYLLFATRVLVLPRAYYTQRAQNHRRRPAFALTWLGWPSQDHSRAPETSLSVPAFLHLESVVLEKVWVQPTRGRRTLQMPVWCRLLVLLQTPTPATCWPAPRTQGLREDGQPRKAERFIP